MLEVSETQLKNKPNYLLYIHTPFCGTCHVARTFLEKIEATHRQTIFYEMNGSLNPDFMQRNKIESVPCLLIKRDDEIKEKIYTFHSVANIYQYLFRYQPELFSTKK